MPAAVDISNIAPTIITKHPSSFIGSVGNTVSFNVEAASGSTYQWQYSYDNGAT